MRLWRSSHAKVRRVIRTTDKYSEAAQSAGGVKLCAWGYAGETACATNGKSFACIGGTGFSLSTPACGRIFSHLLRDGLLKAPPYPVRDLAECGHERPAGGGMERVDRKSVV